ncbi:DUF4238 domain-containing protein [Streptococcus ovis]|uniref:DUF4238 domain-containing protein n=1 Tax=Streptococcus ovis TaxID=82806 RepID=UPI000373B8AB|nr:DUF4238 domain-containing protein [Streptococcus ovis]
MVKSKIKQHVVPQSYLKRFAQKNTNNNGYNISVYHVVNGKIFISAIKDVAFEKNYYDVSNRENEKHWEEYFATQIEPLYGQDLTNIISRITLINKKEDILEIEHKIKLSKMLGFQFVRVPGFLERRFKHGSELFDETIKETRERFSDSNIPNLESILGQFIANKSNIIKDLTLDLISQEERLILFSTVLQNKSWIIYYNNSEMPFITSDNPVVMANFNTNSIGYSDNGLGRNDNIIYFPLSSKILLELVPRNEETVHLDNSLNILSDENLEFITAVNSLQIIHSTKQSFIHPNYQQELENIIEYLKRKMVDSK